MCRTISKELPQPKEKKMVEDQTRDGETGQFYKIFWGQHIRRVEIIKFEGLPAYCKEVFVLY